MTDPIADGEQPTDEKTPADQPVEPGYRMSRRHAKARRSKESERGAPAGGALSRAGQMARTTLFWIAVGVGALLVGTLVFALVATGINATARWWALRTHAGTGSQADLERRSKENVLFIGVKDGEPVGFLAVRIDAKNKQVFGIAVPTGAFIEVPGQGFERVGDSFASGPEVSLAAISNYLTVPFRTYVEVPAQAYTKAVRNQSLASIAESVTATNMRSGDAAALSGDVASIPQKSTAIVPLPVKPIRLGSQTYFEPQRAQVADLLKSWWGVDLSKEAATTRVIVYNGAGTPGTAGAAAQQLIRAGFKVVDTKNADNFNYAGTLVVVQRGPTAKGNEIAKVLGAGTVKTQKADQDVADVIVIIGKDYKVPSESEKGTP